MQYPRLIPFAALGQTNDPEATLRRVAQAVSQILDTTIQANLTAASATLARLRLENGMVYRVLRKDIMQESTVYRSILAEGETKGEKRKQREIALNLLRGGVAIGLISSATGFMYKLYRSKFTESRYFVPIVVTTESTSNMLRL